MINGSEVQLSKQVVGSEAQYVFEGGKIENLETIVNIDVLDELGDIAQIGTMIFDWANATK